MGHRGRGGESLHMWHKGVMQREFKERMRRKVVGAAGERGKRENEDECSSTMHLLASRRYRKAKLFKLQFFISVQSE